MLSARVHPMSRACFIKLDVGFLQLGSELLNELLIFNAYFTYRNSFLSRDTGDTIRKENLSKFVKFHSECPILLHPSNGHITDDSSNDSSDGEH